MKHLFMKSAAFAIAASLAASPVAAQLASTKTFVGPVPPVATYPGEPLQSKTTVIRIPSTYYEGEYVVGKLPGFIAIINDINNVNIGLTNNKTNNSCDAFRDQLLKDNCIFYNIGGRADLTCANFYGPGKRLAAYQPPNGRAVGDLMPNKNAIEVVSSLNSESNLFAFNLGFFETRSFTNRPVEGPTWKGIYDETCTTIAGTYSNDGTSFMGRWGDRMFSSSNVPDKAMTTIIIRAGSPVLYALNEQNVDASVLPGDKVFSGILIREKGQNIHASAGRWPDFVVEKRFSAVGRTAIGIDKYGRKMKIVVVQNGNGGTNTDAAGATIGKVRDMFENTEYPTVFLLDGSGSSQFATNMTLDSTSGTPLASRIRANCFLSGVAACTWWGDTAESTLINHYYPGWTPSNDETASTTDRWVDRRVPAIMTISGPK